MKIYFIIICLNYISIRARNYVIRIPRMNSELKKNVIYRVVRPSNNMNTRLSNGAIEIQLIKESTTVKVSPEPVINKTTPESTTNKAQPTRFDMLEALKPLQLPKIHSAARSGFTRSKRIEDYLRYTRSNSELTTETRKRVAYKEDLDKLLEELAEKQKCTKNHVNNEDKTDDNTTSTHHPHDQSIIVSAPKGHDGKQIKLEKIGQILQLLKSGKKYDRHTPDSNGSLEWMKIKIPKN